ncbi:helix-turn-helix domain-containing protein, partial [Sphingomonas adhaesiva]|uniref:helix-turn-helix domain-containing protein n=1 Tax=Sphingomonas adhaesiva TaxID=28212 RepID=UPI002FFD1E7C
MGKAYSDDLRKRVVAAMATGRSCREVGAAFDVAPSTAGNWWRRYRRESSHAARPMGGDRRSKLLDQAGWIGERLAEVPELTLGEVRSELAGRGIEVSYASVWRTVRRLGLRHKKKGPSSRLSRTGRTSRSRARSGVPHRPDWTSR